MDLLERFGLGDKARHLPGMLSGGQQQRVAIARALANDPGTLLMDEPTGNLDSASEAELLALLGELNKAGKTLIMVTHDEELACHVPRRIEIASGEIVLDGGCVEEEAPLAVVHNPANN